MTDDRTGTEAPSPRTKVRRLADRGRYDEEIVHAILDEGLVAHVGVVVEHGPVVLPMAYARIDRTLYLHGAAANALLKAADDAPLCVTVSLLDGLVLARSAFHHSVNHRSVVVFATGRTVTDETEKRAAFDALIEHVVTGRSAEVRAANPTELRQTRVIAVDLTEASAKVRTGPPIDDEADMDLPVAAGVVPLVVQRGALVPG